MEHSKPVLTPPTEIVIIGCGGVASFLLPCLLKLLKGQTQVVLVDGDKLEMKNLDRQLFRIDQIGQNKAEALKDVLGAPENIRVVPSYFSMGALAVPEGTLIIGCADNHAARKAILETCDDRTGTAIIGGNEYTDADAYYYQFDWRGGPLDPRTYFPEINTDKTGDPTRPAGCQGEAQAQTPQLALANYAAANYMMWLLWFYFAEVRRMDKDTFEFWPVRHFNSFTRCGTQLVRDLQAKAKEKAS
jgi:hypothetical protein